MNILPPQALQRVAAAVLVLLARTSHPPALSSEFEINTANSRLLWSCLLVLSHGQGQGQGQMQFDCLSVAEPI